jgi:hypothetical protein
MKGRFPPDVLVIVLGPLLVAAIALGFGSFIYHAERLRGTVTGYTLVAAGVGCVIAMLLFRRRRR